MNFKKIAIGSSIGGMGFLLIIFVPILVILMITLLFSSEDGDSSSSGGTDDDEDATVIECNGLYFESDCTAFCYPLATDGGTIYITATYGQTGSHWSTIHTGTDFATSISASVVAVAAGEVIEVVNGDSINGNYVVIKHTFETENETLTFYTEYLHMRNGSITVEEGDEVVQGTVLGKEGSTGNVSGMHCHLEFSMSAPTTSSRGGLQLYLVAQDAQYYLYDNHVFDDYKEVYETYFNTTGEDIVEYAKTFLGYDYVYGGTSPDTGFDCSGFTQYVYAHFGYSISRTSSQQQSDGTEVSSKDDLQAGDILCFTGHVGIYIGDGNFIHACNPSKGVIISSLDEEYYTKTYITARRILK